MKKLTIGTLVVVLLIGVGSYLYYLYNLRDPLRGKAQDYINALSVERSLCEDSVLALKKADVDASLEYARVRAKTNGFIDYLKAILDGGGGSENDIKAKLDEFINESTQFQEWVRTRLNLGPPPVGMTVADAVEIADHGLDILGKQEAERREKIKKALDALRFPTWDEIVLPELKKPAGDLVPER